MSLHEVTVEKWVYGGEGLARIESRVALAPFVLPGERVRIELAGKIHASLIEVLEPAPGRVSPPCPLFQRCGGCHYQHAHYAFQLGRKVEILREQLQRVGKIAFDGEIPVVAAEPYGYRNRAQFQVSNGRIGYLAPRSHDLVPVEGDCPVLSPRLNLELARMRDRLGDPRFPPFVRSLEIFTNETEVQLNVLDSARPVARRFYDWCESQVSLEYPTAHGAFRVSPNSFFQVNRFLIDRLVETALADQAGESALDLYSGVGLFALPLARRFAKVTAVEAGGAEAHDLVFNVQRAGAAVEVQYARAERFLAQLDTAPDFVLADPPRSGLGPDVTAALERLAPPRITIVSCDPATLARDLAALPGYRIHSLALVDMFPQTYHIESVVHLSRSR
jgi:23S rRNA (uracil1939-C5)-methyltransferase